MSSWLSNKVGDILQRREMESDRRYRQARARGEVESRESVEQFLRRGGKITVLPSGLVERKS